MAENQPASRSIYQAHLTSIDEGRDAAGGSLVGDLEKFVFLRRVAVPVADIEPVTERLQKQVSANQAKLAEAVLRELYAEPAAPAALRLVTRMTEIHPDTVAALTETYLGVLADRAKDAVKAEPQGAVAPPAARRPVIANLLGLWRARLTAHPIGRLSLQRLDFVPAGIERGPLLYSLPLAPGERTVVTHKEWATTESEFTDLMSDEMADYSERGVVDKTEITDATTTQQQHTLGLSTSMSASGGFGPVSVSATASLNLSDASSRTSNDSRKKAQEMTTKAAKRSMRRHQVSFRTGRVSGSEDATERAIANPFTDRVARVDYYQMLRKWRVNLYEYDLRLTYDVVVPEPGLAFLVRYDEMRRLQAEQHQELSFPYSASDLTREGYVAIAAQYGVAVEPPPPETDHVWSAETKSWPTRDASNVAEFHTLLVDVPSDYIVTRVAANGDRAPWSSGDPHTFWIPDQRALNGTALASGWVGKAGTMRLIYRTWHLNSCFVQVEVETRLKPEAFAAWQTRAYNQIRDAALARHYARQQTLQDRVEELQRRIGAQDTLSLRKAEREELMRGALQWMLGPDFSFELPPGLTIPTDASAPDELTYATLQSRGEVIKFLHHAVEWENMTYFLYPYFWSHDDEWPLRRDIDHPDLVHKAFLRAGAARLVLPIRRGYEREFVAFVASGRLDGSSPYMTIADEIRRDAETRYPEVPGTDPDESTDRARGTLVASWWQWTPTSAVDIALGDTSSTPSDPRD